MGRAENVGVPMVTGGGPKYGVRRSLGCWFHAQAERVSRGVGMDDEDAIRFFNRPAQDLGAELHRLARSTLQIRHREVQVDLLGDAVGPLRPLVGAYPLECEFHARAVNVNFAPIWIGEVGPAAEEFAVERGQRGRIGAVEHH